MEDSFNELEFRLILNPSPTFKKKGKEIKHKLPTKLALKKTLTRSSMFDKLPMSIENSKINMVDAETTESSSQSSASTPYYPSGVKPRRGFFINHDSECESIRDDAINNAQLSKQSEKKNLDNYTSVIATTEDEDEVIPATAENSPVKTVSPDGNLNAESLKANEHLSVTKFELIKNWVENVARPIQPDVARVDKSKIKVAINSTFALEKTCVPFDQWIREAHKTVKKKEDSSRNLGNQKKLACDKENETPQPDTNSQLHMKYFVREDVRISQIDENVQSKEISLTMTDNFLDRKLSKSSDERNSVKSNKTSNKSSKDSKVKLKKTSLADETNKLNHFKTPTVGNMARTKELDDVIITPVKQITSNNDDVASVLDTLYGNSWHKNRDQIFSEPRPPKKKIQISKLKEPQTEKKPQRDVLYKNPYLDSEREKSTGLLKSLQKQRIQSNIESPFFARPKIVDDDTPSPAGKEETKPNVVDIKTSTSVRTKHEDKNGLSSLNLSDLDIGLPNRLKKKHLPALPKPKSALKSHKRIIAISDSDSDCDTSRKSASSSSNSNNSGFRRPARKATQKPKSYKNIDDLTDRIVNITIDDLSSGSESDTDESFIIRPKKDAVTCKTKTKPTKLQHQTPQVHSFLASLSKGIPDEQCDPSALVFKTNYKKHRDALAKKLFDMFNEAIFDKRLEPNTPIEWSARMTGCAGLCRCLRRTHRDGKVTRAVKLRLSTKVLDSADRLRDTLVHEMCHAATYFIDEVSDGHGRFWKAWATKAVRVFPDLPPISRCHNYAINYKFTYTCTGCGYSFGRHSKSLDLERKRCGLCYGTFEVMLNKTNQGGQKKSVPCTPKKEATGFAKFVKDNYALHKSPGVNHADLMRLLGKKYAEAKTGNK